MEDVRLVPVSARHAVRLAPELLVLLDRPQQQDYVVRTITRREANGLPLMSAEIVIAGRETRDRHAQTREYPLHFRKTYFPGRLHGEPSVEYENQLAASRIIPVAPPLGYAPDVFRACLVPGTPYARLTPFRGEPPENDLPKARRLELAPAAGLYRLCEEAFHHLAALHAAGLAHGDAELHNLIVCPSPLEIVVIDFESAIRREVLTPEAWAARVEADRVPLLREAVFLQCALGRQRGPLADVAFERTDALFKDGARFRRAIEDHAELD